MEILDIKQWAGTDESFAQYMLGVRTFLAQLGAEKHADYLSDNSPRDMPRLLSKHGSVGVITIAGSLNNTDSWMNRYIGAVGYPEIRQALVHAAKDSDIKAIVLDIKSGGGAVSGMVDTAELVKRVDKDVKPVYSYTDSMAASAGYALFSSARGRAMSRTAEVGSIGVLVVHKEMTKMLEDEGITPTVIRSGKYKALGNPYEKLSDLAAEVLKESVDATAEIFEELVADNLGVAQSVVHNKMGQGKVFMGQEAVDLGLAEETTNFDAFMSKVMGGIDAANTGSKYGSNLRKGPHVKAALTESDIAALAAGAAAQDLDNPAPAADAPAAEAPADPAADAAVDTPAPAADAATSAQLDLLKAQLADANKALMANAVELAQAKASAEKFEASLAGLRTVALAAVGNLRIALGGSRDGLEALTHEQIVAEHTNLDAQFKTKFKAGGVAVRSAAAAEQPSTAVNETLRRARIQATRQRK